MAEVVLQVESVLFSHLHGIEVEVTVIEGGDDSLNQLMPFDRFVKESSRQASVCGDCGAIIKPFREGQ